MGFGVRWSDVILYISTNGMLLVQSKCSVVTNCWIMSNIPFRISRVAQEEGQCTPFRRCGGMWPCPHCCGPHRSVWWWRQTTVAPRSANPPPNGKLRVMCQWGSSWEMWSWWRYWRQADGSVSPRPPSKRTECACASEIHCVNSVHLSLFRSLPWYTLSTHGSKNTVPVFATLQKQTHI